MLYKVAYATGFRCSELHSVTTDLLSLDRQPSTITVEAAHSKRRERDEQLIPSWLADDLRAWLNSRSTARIGTRGAVFLWPGSWASRAAEMIRLDLTAAGIEHSDDVGRVFDFHAQRMIYTTGHSDRGLHLKTTQSLARHSDINLTMNTYTAIRRVDQVEAVEAIPNPTAIIAQQRQRATGTDASRPAVAPPVARVESEQSDNKRSQKQSRRLLAKIRLTPVARTRKT